MKKGFTLIELLVVVLIVGILSAIALPQYRKAIDKSRTAQYLVMLKHFQDASAIYRLANSAPPSSLQELDIEYELTNCSMSGVVQICTINRMALLSYSTTGLWFTLHSPDLPHDYLTYDPLSGHENIFCQALDSYGELLCQSLGGSFFWGYSEGKRYIL